MKVAEKTTGFDSLKGKQVRLGLILDTRPVCASDPCASDFRRGDLVTVTLLAEGLNQAGEAAGIVLDTMRVLGAPGVVWVRVVLHSGHASVARVSPSLLRRRVLEVVKTR